MDLSRLLDAIDESGLHEIAKGYAFDTAMKIVTTGQAIDHEWNDVETMNLLDEDAAFTARVLSDPMNWGIADERWKEFCDTWRNNAKSQPEEK